MTLELANKAKISRINNGKTLKDVADALGYTAENIRLFEIGRNNSATILLYYINEFGLEVRDNEC